MEVLLCCGECVVLVSQNCNKAANCETVSESMPRTFIARRVKSRQVREIATALKLECRIARALASALKAVLSGFSVVSVHLINSNRVGVQSWFK